MTTNKVQMTPYCHLIRIQSLAMIGSHHPIFQHILGFFGPMTKIFGGSPWCYHPSWPLVSFHFPQGKDDWSILDVPAFLSYFCLSAATKSISRRQGSETEYAAISLIYSANQTSPGDVLRTLCPFPSFPESAS